jgi:hypothetical protein
MEHENLNTEETANSDLGAVSCRLLLEKYIRYVMEAEGSDFIRYGKDWATYIEFTEQEWKLLTEIATKVNGS